MSNTVGVDDTQFMMRAFRMAERHVGLTNPNPCVGAIVTSESGCVVGTGVTGEAGVPHAEPQALAQAGEAARGGTLYVTLEPCNHHGRTPPCTDAIIAAGIQRVVAAMADPDPRVSGTGFQRLEEAGIEVLTSVCEAHARRFHASHVITKRLRRPFIYLKLAISTDGMIGKLGVANYPITGDISANYTQMMRARSDAILVGASTARLDNPRLSCRLPGMSGRSPRRFVLSNQRKKVRQEQPVGGIFEGSDSDSALMVVGGKPLPSIAETIFEIGHHSLMVEGGAKTARAFHDDGLLDAVFILRAPTRVGIEGIESSIESWLEPNTYELVDQRQLGEDRVEEFWRRDF